MPTANWTQRGHESGTKARKIATIRTTSANWIPSHTIGFSRGPIFVVVIVRHYGRRRTRRLEPRRSG